MLEQGAVCDPKTPILQFNTPEVDHAEKRPGAFGFPDCFSTFTCIHVCSCSHLLPHHHAAFVCLLLVYLVDFVPLALVETLQSDTEKQATFEPGDTVKPRVVAELLVPRGGQYLFSSCTSSSSCCPFRVVMASSNLLHISSFSFCSRLQHCVDRTGRRRRGLMEILIDYP